jgi:hypothetical protein
MGSGGISVHRQALLNQATFWDAQAAATGGYGRQAAGAMWHGEAGIFASVVNPYNQVCQEVSQWCDQGQAQMQAIGNALVTAARNYQSTEDTNAGLSSAAVRGSVRG